MEKVNYLDIESIQPCIDCDRDVAYSYDFEDYVHIQEPERGCGVNDGRGGTTMASKEIFRFINRDKWDWNIEK